MGSAPHLHRAHTPISDNLTALINLVRLRGELVAPDRRIDAGRDPQDNRFLEAAAAGHADAIVSGDADLLEMRECEAIPILRVPEFLARL